MSRAAEARLDFAGEERLFRLGIGQLRALDEACDCGPMELLSRLTGGAWRIADLRQVLFEGLKGGGMSDAEATALIRTTVDVGPLQQYVPVAQAVVLACVVGVEDDDLGEPKGEATDDRPSPMDASGSPASMAPAPSSD